ncbi:transposase [Vibrio crassostreae]|nr:transposase [Vibrio crassostreae]
MSKKLTPFERYEAYIKNLSENEQPLPVNQFGDVNFTEIAKACNNRRQWFSENAEKEMPNGRTLKATVAFNAETLGTAMTEPKSSDVVLSEKAEELRKENNKLRRIRDMNTGELERLRKENEQLKSQLKMSKEEAANRFNEMMESGRSFLCN